MKRVKVAILCKKGKEHFIDIKNGYTDEVFNYLCEGRKQWKSVDIESGLVIIKDASSLADVQQKTIEVLPKIKELKERDYYKIYVKKFQHLQEVNNDSILYPISALC